MTVLEVQLQYRDAVLCWAISPEPPAPPLRHPAQSRTMACGCGTRILRDRGPGPVVVVSVNWVCGPAERRPPELGNVVVDVVAGRDGHGLSNRGGDEPS